MNKIRQSEPNDSKILNSLSHCFCEFNQGTFVCCSQVPITEILARDLLIFALF